MTQKLVQSQFILCFTCSNDLVLAVTDQHYLPLKAGHIFATPMV